MLIDNNYRTKRLIRKSGVISLYMLSLIFSPEDTIDDIAIYRSPLSCYRYSYSKSIQSKGKIDCALSKVCTLQNKCKQDALERGIGK